MRQNLDRSNYLVLAEAAVLALAGEIPRTKAHALVKKACEGAVSEDRSLIEILKQQFSEIVPQNKIDWEALAKPENYLGQTEHFIDSVLEQVRTIKSAD